MSYQPRFQDPLPSWEREGEYPGNEVDVVYRQGLLAGNLIFFF